MVNQNGLRTLKNTTVSITKVATNPSEEITFYSEINKLIQNYISVGNVKDTFKIGKGNSTVTEEVKVQVNEAMVCVALGGGKAKNTGRKVILQSVHETDEQDSFHHLAETQGKRNRPERHRTRLRNRNNSTTGPDSWHTTMTRPKIVEAQLRITRNLLQ